MVVQPVLPVAADQPSATVEPLGNNHSESTVARQSVTPLFQKPEGEQTPPEESLRPPSTPAVFAIELSIGGAFGSAVLLLSVMAGGGLFALPFIGWGMIPYLATALLAYLYRGNRTSGLLTLIASIVGVVVGIGLPVYVLFFSKPDAQNGMVFLSGPALQCLLISPFLIAVFFVGQNRARKGKEAADREASRF